MWVVGDPQGHLTSFRRILRQVGLMDASGAWSGGDATLAVVGDLVDRGPDGIGVIDLLMSLQPDATRQGGAVRVLIGNHDILFLAARRFPELLPRWEAMGGLLGDLERCADRHVEWLGGLPAMVLHNDVLLVHADATFYLEYGSTVDEVNAAFRAALSTRDVQPWTRLLDRFSEHRAFFGEHGCATLERFLATFGGRVLIHGHTPIARMLHVPPGSVTAAYVYCGGRCVNVDPGLYLGGAGFAYAPRADGRRR